MIVLLGIVIVMFLVVVLGAIFFVKRNNQETVADRYKGSELASSVFIKKYPEADLSKLSSVFLALGMIFSIGASAYALSWVKKDLRANSQVEIFVDDDFEIEPPQTKQEKPPPPPPPPPELEVVEDEEILDEEPEIEEVEVDEEEVVEVPDEPEEEVVEEPEIFTIVEDMPRFPGCESEGSKDAKKQCADTKLLQYLGKIKYPQMAKENDIEGRVFVRFVINTSGKVEDVNVARSADKILDEAAVKHIRNMPKWVPGKQRGKPVKVQFVVPINFKLS